MSTEKKKKPGAGLYFLPLLIASPLILGMVAAAVRYWPKIHKLLNIMIKLVVKA